MLIYEPYLLLMVALVLTTFRYQAILRSEVDIFNYLQERLWQAATMLTVEPPPRIVAADVTTSSDNDGGAPEMEEAGTNQTSTVRKRTLSSKKD